VQDLERFYQLGVTPKGAPGVATHDLQEPEVDRIKKQAQNHTVSLKDFEGINVFQYQQIVETILTKL